MTTFTTVPLNNLNPNRELFRMSGNRFMEILWQAPNATDPEYKIMRVVDMGAAGVTPSVISSTYILPNNLPFDVKEFVVGGTGMTAAGSSTSYNEGTTGAVDVRGYYGASVPMSSTQLLITHGTKMYRFRYDEGVTNEIIFDGEVTQVGGALPECHRYGTEKNNTSVNYLTSGTGLYRMGTSNSFILNRQPKDAPATNTGPDSQDVAIFQVWEYDNTTNTITLKKNEAPGLGTESGAILRAIPDSDSVFVGKWYGIQPDPTHDVGSGVYIRNSYVYHPDGTSTTLHGNSDSPLYFMPLPLSTTQVWWAGTTSAMYYDYSTPANNKTINYPNGALPFGTLSAHKYPNEGWAVSDSEFVAARNFYNGTMDLIAIKDTGFGFGDWSPNGVQSIGEAVVTYSAGTYSNEYEAEFIEFHSINGSGGFGNAIYKIDDNNYQYECVAVRGDTTTPGSYDAKLYQYRIKRA